MNKRLLGPALGVGLLSAATWGAGDVVERAVAIVNDEPIWLSQFRQGLERSQQLGGVRVEKEKLLELMIDDLLIRHEAKVRAIEVMQGDVETELKHVRAQFSSDEEFAVHLGREGLTESEFREELKRQLMAQRLVQMEVRGKVEVTDREVDEYYQSRRGDFEEPETVRLRVFQTKDAGVMAQARKALADGTAFSDVIKKFGDDALKASEGALEPFKVGSLNEGVARAIAALRVGEVSDIVKEGPQLMVFRLEERIPGRQLALTDPVPGSPRPLKEHIQLVLLDKKLKDRYDAWVKGLRAKAVIERKALP